MTQIAWQIAKILANEMVSWYWYWYWFVSEGKPIALPVASGNGRSNKGLVPYFSPKEFEC